MSKQLKLAISGKARVGKNTLANLIIDRLDLKQNDFKLRAFADPMKQIAKIMFPMADDEALYGESELRSNIISPDYIDAEGNQLTYRQFLCDLGKFGRRYNPKIWINNLDYDYKQSGNIIYIVSDLRFKDELQYLLDEQFYIVRIKRKTMHKTNDISETEQESIPDTAFHYVVNNDYSIDYLMQETQKLLSKQACM